MRPLDRMPSIKIKLGTIIVGAVAVTTTAIVVGVEIGLGWLLSALTATALGLLAIQLLARGMTSPLRDMAAASRAMARGDYSKRVTASSRDEVGDLARAFNKMASDLEEIDRLRRDLVANVSHELRTPITALQAVLENLIDGVEQPDREALGTMLAQVHRLSRLIDQLLELSKLEAGTIPLTLEELSIGGLLEQVVRESRIHADKAYGRKVDFEIEVEPNDLVGRADGHRLHQVLMNLVDNAIRHSPEEGVVSIRAGRRADALVLEVVDEGAGISRAESGKVFERFYRSDSARSSAGGGSGLGLAIVRWIVDLHGGQISVEENHPRGCRMVVALPEAAR